MAIGAEPEDTLGDAVRSVASHRGFHLSSDPGVGRLLSVLAAAVRPGGRILELGTGAGVGLAAIVAGLAGRTDVEVTTVETDENLWADVAALSWPPYVRCLHADGVGFLRGGTETFDLVFADAEAGKTVGFDLTLERLAPGGLLVLDDMIERPADPIQAAAWPRLADLRRRVLSDPALVAVDLDWASGVIVAARRPARASAPRPGGTSA